MTAANVLQDVETQGVSFGPILKHFFGLCRIEEIIDQSVNMDPRRKILTHGQASVAMITAILFQVMRIRSGGGNNVDTTRHYEESSTGVIAEAISKNIAH